jgi:hypothetical protein
MCDGCYCRVKTPQDCYIAIDRLHTKVLDEMGENSYVLRILETAMESMMELKSVDPFKVK